MRAGRLRHRVTVQRKVKVRTGSGEATHTWENVAVDIAALVEDVGGGEALRGDQVSSQVSTRITIRYRTGLRPTMRVVQSVDNESGAQARRMFNILFVNNYGGRNKEIQLMCDHTDATTWELQNVQ